MSKILEKLLKDALKENAIIMGTKQVLTSVQDSKLIMLSQSVEKELGARIKSDAEKDEIPLVNFRGTSVALGKLCGLQFRISTLSFTSLTDSNIKSILKESEAEEMK